MKDKIAPPVFSSLEIITQKTVIQIFKPIDSIYDRVTEFITECNF